MLYRTALERFVLVALLFALGMGGLQLDPPALLAGFIMGQLVITSYSIHYTKLYDPPQGHGPGWHAAAPLSGFDDG